MTARADACAEPRLLRVVALVSAETHIRVLARVGLDGARDDARCLAAEVDEDLCAERLGEVTNHLDAAVGGNVRLDARVLEVLGPDAEDDLLAEVLLQA